MIQCPRIVMSDLMVVGGGLAGCEAAWQAARRGLSVRLCEMRPQKTTSAHKTGNLAEIVCSNSLGSTLPNRSSGTLIAELKQLDSLLLQCAFQSQVPAGQALAVDREAFSHAVQDALDTCANIELVREEITEIPSSLSIIASGPLTSPSLAQSISRFTRTGNLFFFDAVAPIVTAESIDMEIAYWGSRFEKGEKEEGDYLNCPFYSRVDYEHFVQELAQAERIPLRDFEVDIEAGVQAGKGKFFEACLPIEVMAMRGKDTLSYGPLRPLGLRNPHTGSRPYAVVQLRQDNLSATLYNLVGFQTNLTYSEQKRVFRLIPGLQNAEFVRYGQMHRNTYIYAPDVLRPTLQCIHAPGLFMAGQIAGIEGYLGNIGTGLLAGINAARFFHGQALLELPATTLLGALCQYISTPNPHHFQPMNATYRHLPPFEDKIKCKADRFAAYAQRSSSDLSAYLDGLHEQI
jgi:methylenetetrahydrofolate--tRNA-(uracil-5-)-methyltransferase